MPLSSWSKITTGERRRRERPQRGTGVVSAARVWPGAQGTAADPPRPEQLSDRRPAAALIDVSVRLRRDARPETRPGGRGGRAADPGVRQPVVVVPQFEILRR